MSEVGGRRSEGEKTDVGGRKSEGGGRKPEVGGHPGEIEKKKAFHWVKKSEVGGRILIGWSVLCVGLSTLKMVHRFRRLAQINYLTQRREGAKIKKLVTFKSVYMGVFYDFLIAQIQLLLMSTRQQKSSLCENGSPRSSSEHRGLFCGKSAT